MANQEGAGCPSWCTQSTHCTRVKPSPVFLWLQESSETQTVKLLKLFKSYVQKLRAVFSLGTSVELESSSILRLAFPCSEMSIP